MKTPYLILATSLCSFFSASCSKSLDYEIEVKNIGSKPIWVNTFFINKTQKIGVGILPPNISKTTMSIQTKPDNEFFIRWTEEGSHDSGCAAVNIQLPIQFWEKFTHHTMTINLNPDVSEIDVVYTGGSSNESKNYFSDSRD